MEVMKMMEMVHVCEDIEMVVKQAKNLLREDHPERAMRKLSQIYILGLGQMIDDLHRMREPKCQHDMLISNTSGNKVWMKCRKCYKETTTQL